MKNLEQPGLCAPENDGGSMSALDILAKPLTSTWNRE